MSGDFDRIISRQGTASVKHDGRGTYFGTQDLIPLWVADMDFAAPPAITQALMERAAHPIYGYTLQTDGLFEALIGWMQKRHGWEIRREWIVLSPGVVPSLHAAVMAFSGIGEGVIVQPPVYFPFFSAVTIPERRLILNPLREVNGHYQFDFDQLEQAASNGTRLLLLCSPHNPVGRVWNRDELEHLLHIARRHDLVILSDEIHSDLLFKGYKHIPTAMLAEKTDPVITAVAPSKTFNIPGLGLSALIIPDPQHRAAIRKSFDLLHLGATNPFSLIAFESAYREGEEWLESLLVYLQQTRDYVIDFFSRHAPAIKVIPPEGTYLLWLDCRALGMNDESLKRFFVHRAKVGMNPGIIFGEGGSGFMRMNIGAPKAIITEALERIAEAVSCLGL